MSKIESLKVAEWIEQKPYKALKPKNKARVLAGLDTETDPKTGIPFLLSYSTDDTEGWSLVNEDNWLDLLTSCNFEGRINFFYNMQYDIEGFLKFLPPDMLCRLYFDKRVVYNGCLLKYIPKKFFEIRKGRHIFKYYDLWQYFNTSLEVASQKYLGQGKAGDYGADMDPKRFFSDREYHDNVINYCMVDSERCRQLAHFLFDTFLEQGYSSFISTASLSEEYFRRHGLEVQHLEEPVARVFLQAYFGGRFEVTKRGTWEHVKEYDLNSAYPSVMASMPILTRNFYVKEGAGWDYPLYGCYHVKVEIPDDSYYGLLPYRQKDGLVVYPTGRMDTFVSYPELEKIERLGLDYSIEHSWEVYDESASPALQEPIEELYRLKLKAKKEKNEALYQQAKILLNSPYGKFIQSTQQTHAEIVHDASEIKKDDHIVEVADTLYRAVRLNTFKLGRLFNPAYAAHITAATRCRLVNSLEDTRVLAFHTDSILTTALLDTGPDLGQWELKSQGLCEIVKCGFYKIDNKVRTRGVRSYRVGSGLEYRRTGIGSAVRRNMLGEMNVIRPVAVVVTNKDRKRQWFDLNNEQQDSYALDIQDLISKAKEKDMKLWYKSTRRPSLRALKASGIDTALIDSTLTTDENRRLLRPSMRDMEGRL